MPASPFHCGCDASAVAGRPEWKAVRHMADRCCEAPACHPGRTSADRTSTPPGRGDPPACGLSPGAGRASSDGMRRGEAAPRRAILHRSGMSAPPCGPGAGADVAGPHAGDSMPQLAPCGVLSVVRGAACVAGGASIGAATACATFRLALFGQLKGIADLLAGSVGVMVFTVPGAVAALTVHRLIASAGVRRTVSSSLVAFASALVGGAVLLADTRELTTFALGAIPGGMTGAASLLLDAVASRLGGRRC